MICDSRNYVSFKISSENPIFFLKILNRKKKNRSYKVRKFLGAAYGMGLGPACLLRRVAVALSSLISDVLPGSGADYPPFSEMGRRIITKTGLLQLPT